MPLGHDRRQRPVLLTPRVKTDGELLGAARKVDKSVLRIERGPAAVLADLDQGGLLRIPPRIHAQHVDQAALAGVYRVAFQPSAKAAVKPFDIARQEVAEGPIGRVQQVRIDRHREHPGTVSDAPSHGGVPALHPAPQPSGVLDDRHRGTMILAVVAQQARLGVLRLGPRGAPVGRSPNDRMAVVPVGAEDVQRAAMDEETGPELPLNLGDLRPTLAAVR